MNNHHVLFSEIFSEIPPEKAELQIYPQTVGNVEQNNRLTFTCTATNVLFNLVSWIKAGAVKTYDIRTDTCESFNNDIDFAVHQFSCSRNVLTWTILKVTKHQHGDEWYCKTNDLLSTESSKTRIFVKGNSFAFTTGK